MGPGPAGDGVRGLPDDRRGALRWDPFIRHQHLIDADRPGKGVRTLTRARLGPRMVSEYVSYRPPTSVGMTMVSGPWFFASFGGGWRFVPETREAWPGRRRSGSTPTRPAGVARFVAEPVGQWLLGREIRARIAAFAGRARTRRCSRRSRPAFELPPIEHVS